jgi:hypothetical protein
MSDVWRTLRIGDTVRVVAWPEELHEDRLHHDTRELYRWLIETKTPLRIVEMDKVGLPQGEVCRTVNGVEYHEFLLLNHSGLEVVAKGTK